MSQKDGQNVPKKNTAIAQEAGSGLISLLLWAVFQIL